MARSSHPTNQLQNRPRPEETGTRAPTYEEASAFWWIPASTIGCWWQNKEKISLEAAKQKEAKRKKKAVGTGKKRRPKPKAQGAGGGAEGS